MDEFSKQYTLNDLIDQFQREPIYFITIHLLTDEISDFVLAVSWNDLDEIHFKMFKKQTQAEILLFSQSISEQYNNWHNQICHWLRKPLTPLKLNNQKQSIRQQVSNKYL